MNRFARSVRTAIPMSVPLMSLLCIEPERPQATLSSAAAIIRVIDSLSAAAIALPRTLEALCLQHRCGTELSAIPHDGWGSGFRYSSDGASFRLSSAGPDEVFDTIDDIDLHSPFRTALVEAMRGSYCVVGAAGPAGLALLNLETQALDGVRFRARAANGYGEATIGYWHPWIADSVVVWLNYQHGTVLSVAIGPDTVSGWRLSRALGANRRRGWEAVRCEPTSSARPR